MSVILKYPSTFGSNTWKANTGQTFQILWWKTLVEDFKFFSEKIGEKLPLFFTHFSLKNFWKFHVLFQYFFESESRWKIWNKIYDFSCKSNTNIHTFFHTFYTENLCEKFEMKFMIFIASVIPMIHAHLQLKMMVKRFFKPFSLLFSPGKRQ